MQCQGLPSSYIRRILSAGIPTRGVTNAVDGSFGKVPEAYIGFVEELPGANTQGATLEEMS